MDVNKKLPKDKDIRCFNIISNKKDKQYGEKCGRLLIKRNSKSNVAGQVKCGRCKAIYEIVDNKIKLITRGE